MNRIWGFLFLSLALHIFSGTVATVVAPYFSGPQRHQTSTVELLENAPKKKSQDEREASTFAGKLEIPDKFKIKKEVKKQFFAEDDVTVLEQTRAADSGANVNRLNNVHRGMQIGQKGMAREMAVSELQKFAHGDVDVNSKARSGDKLKPLNLPMVPGEQLDDGKSAFAYSAPDIKIGKITALNTDRFVYYGFYQRTDERIYPRWENFIKAAVYTYQNSHRVFGSKDFSARYEVLLRPDGTYEKAILRESSGENGIDLALAQSFKLAQQIPHPPPEMIQSDGFIHLNYGITVEIGPGQFAEAE